jgi:hypothetical protein
VGGLATTAGAFSPFTPRMGWDTTGH